MRKYGTHAPLWKMWLFFEIFVGIPIFLVVRHFGWLPFAP